MTIIGRVFPLLARTLRRKEQLVAAGMATIAAAEDEVS